VRERVEGSWVDGRWLRDGPCGLCGSEPVIDVRMLQSHPGGG